MDRSYSGTGSYKLEKFTPRFFNKELVKHVGLYFAHYILCTRRKTKDDLNDLGGSFRHNNSFIKFLLPFRITGIQSGWNDLRFVNVRTLQNVSLTKKGKKKNSRPI